MSEVLFSTSVTDPIENIQVNEKFAQNEQTLQSLQWFEHN